MDILDKLKPASYKWKDNEMTQSLKGNINPGKKSFGFIAQDLAKIFPMDEYDVVVENNGVLEVQYYQLIPILTKEIQDLKKRVQELEDKVGKQK